jgi:hypothetical protein
MTDNRWSAPRHSDWSAHASVTSKRVGQGFVTVEAAYRRARWQRPRNYLKCDCSLPS